MIILQKSVDFETSAQISRNQPFSNLYWYNCTRATLAILHDQRASVESSEEFDQRGTRQARERGRREQRQY